MKAFLAALLFVAIGMIVTGAVYETFTLTASEAYSRPSARVGHDNPAGGRLGWSPDAGTDVDVDAGT